MRKGGPAWLDSQVPNCTGARKRPQDEPGTRHNVVIRTLALSQPQFSLHAVHLPPKTGSVALHNHCDCIRRHRLSAGWRPNQCLAAILSCRLIGIRFSYRRQACPRPCRTASPHVLDGLSAPRHARPAAFWISARSLPSLRGLCASARTFFAVPFFLRDAGVNFRFEIPKPRSRRVC